MLCEDLLLAQDFSEVIRQGGGEDGGVDIWANQVGSDSDPLRTAIQCKLKGEHGRVGLKDVILFHGKLSTDHKHHRAIVMTAGGIEEDAADWARTRGVEFWDGFRLFEMMITSGIGFELFHGTDDDLAARPIASYWDDLVRRARAEHENRRKRSMSVD